MPLRQAFPGKMLDDEMKLFRSQFEDFKECSRIITLQGEIVP